MSCVLIQPSQINKRQFNSQVINLPLITCKVSAGFPSPADDHLDNPLNLNDLLVKHAAATFLVRATGHSMRGIGIFNNDILVVDRSETPINGCVVIAAIDGECLVKIYRHEKKQFWLEAANPNFPNIPVDENTGLEIWGVVTGVVRQLDGGFKCSH